MSGNDSLLYLKASQSSTDENLGKVLGLPLNDGSFEWWDKLKLSGPVVSVQEDGNGNPLLYSMYYYGRDSHLWNFGVEPFNAGLPTGRVGLATSQDGMNFERYKGPLSGGAVLDPSDDAGAFDAVHIAVSEVLYFPNLHDSDFVLPLNVSVDASSGSKEAWIMFYSAGGMEEAPMIGSIRVCKGVTLRPGYAMSRDGSTFTRPGTGPILELGEPSSWDSNGIAWPRVLRLPSDSPLDAKWLMTYHTRERGGYSGTGFYSAGVALSSDGKHWVKHGKVLSLANQGSWDEGGTSVRCVVYNGGQFLMFYEGCDNKFNYAIGLATSPDGLNWARDSEVGPEPGGPIFRARVGEIAWDNVIVGTPYVVAKRDGSFWMYYLGIGKKDGESYTPGIGLAVSDGKNFREWKRFKQ